MDSSDLSDGPITLQEYLEVKKALASSEAKVQQLMKVNNNLSEELRRLQKEVGMTGWPETDKVKGSAGAITSSSVERSVMQEVGVKLYKFVSLFNNSGEREEAGKRCRMIN